MSRAVAGIGALAAAALLVLTSAAGAAPAGKAAARAVPESLRVLARVGRESITRADVQRRLEEIPEQVRSSYTTPEGRQQLLDRLIEERLWIQMAVRAGVPERPEVKKQLESARRDLLIRTYLGEVMAENPAPGDSAARAYYESHTPEYRIPATVTVRHIQSKTEADARRVLGWAKAPNQDFAKLAQKYSADSLTKASGGMLGTVTPDGIFGALGAQPALAQAAFALESGKVGGPVRTDRGWHVIKIDGKQPESVRSFEQVRPMILRQMSSQGAQDFYRQKLDAARKQIGVTPDSSAIKPFLSARKSARDLFKEAQEAGGATDRIARYRQLLEQYPDSDVSPQAQFMIGFIYSEELRNYDEAEKAFRQVLSRYPKSELAPSAQWMVEHMRTEDAPAFLNLEADTSRVKAAPAKKGSSDKP